MPGRLVAVSTLPLWPTRDGISLRAVRLLDELATRWAVRLVAPAPADGVAPLPSGMTLIPIDPLRRWSPAPPVAALASASRAVRETLAREPADALLLWVGAEPIAFNRDDLPPTVGDRIDAMTLAATRGLRHAAGVLPLMRELRSVAAYAAYERRVVRSQTATVVVGADDARVLRRLGGGSRVHVVPNGVAADPEPPTGAEDPRPTAVFSGVLGYPPNVEAVIWFVREVWPHVRAGTPTARFVVAGRGPVEAIRALHGEQGIEVHADVPDMGAELANAWVAVAPMRSGTGIKNKVLEAWAVAKPTVLTTLASNGLTLDDDARRLVADEPIAMAQRMLALFGDAGTRRQLGRAAHALVRRAHGWADAGAALSRLLEKAAGRGPR
jgi:glycosyltransferase involved in cell wall biosynthesis